MSTSESITMATAAPYPEPVSGLQPGVGWVHFAATMLSVAGLMRILDGIWALTYKGSLPENLRDGTLGSDLKTYGWVWIAVGVLLILAGLAVLTRSQLARWFGVVMSGVAMVSATVWLPYYPVWSLVYIGVGAFTLYALVVYGAPESAPAP